MFRLALLLVFVATLAGPATAKITRGCTGFYEVHFWNQSARIGQFHARAECGNTVPNRCRERARKKAQICMDDHFRVKAPKPASCRNPGVHDYRIEDLTPHVAKAFCCARPPARADMTHDQMQRISVYRVTTGDRNCPHRMRLYSGAFNCAGWDRICE